MWIRKVFKILPDLKKTIAIALTFVLVIESLKLVPPYLLKVVIDLLIEPGSSLPQVLTYVAYILLASLSLAVIEDRYILFSFRRIFSHQVDVLKKSHEKLMSLSLGFYEDHNTGALAHLLNHGSEKLLELMYFINDQFMGTAVQVILTSVLLLTVHFWAGLVFVVFIPLVVYMIHRTGKKVQPYREHYHRKYQDASWEMNQSLLNIRTVKDYSQEAKEIKKYSEMLDEYLEMANKRMKKENTDLRNRDIVLSIFRFSLIFYVVYLVFEGSMTPGGLFLFATLSEKVISSLYRLGRLYSYLGDSMEAIRQFSGLFDEETEVKEAPEAIPCENTRGEIEFENVGFSYEGSNEALRNVSLKIPAKKMVAFVGRSGAGKTTAVKLLSRHYDVVEGRIMIDGVDIRKYRLKSYRKQIAVVAQDVEIFDNTVRENISYGRKASLKEIKQAAKIAHAHDFIMNLPKGYDTKLGEKGIKLSGGQKQRIGIARALLMKPAILVFDEATSSLDTESERSIQAALEDISHNQTMIIIAHRLSTIESADMIVVFEEGEIAETGTHKELMEKKGIFARMRKLQEIWEIRD